MQKAGIFFGMAMTLFWGASSSSSLRAEYRPSFLEGTQIMKRATVLEDQAEQNKVVQKKVEKETPFACNMLALNAEGRRRHKVVTEQMKAAIQTLAELPDGYDYRFPAEQSTILLVSEFIARERLCCPFFTFELVVEREDGPLWLRLRGREGVKEFIRAELGVK
jgi:hypothetical protein